MPVFLTIDDSVVEKTGKYMEAVDYHYAHTAGGTVLGHVWVTRQVMVLGQSYPVSWKLYRRKAMCAAHDLPFFSKPELAQAIVREFEALPGTQTYVLTDSWYPSQEMLRVCRDQGYHLISAVKSNRKVKTDEANRQVKQWSQAFSAGDLDLEIVQSICYQIWSTRGRLSSGDAVRLVINRRVGHSQWRYLISTDIALSLQTILSYYLAHWEVENFTRSPSSRWAGAIIRCAL